MDKTEVSRRQFITGAGKGMLGAAGTALLFTGERAATVAEAESEGIRSMADAGGMEEAPGAMLWNGEEFAVIAWTVTYDAGEYGPDGNPVRYVSHLLIEAERREK